MSCPKPMAIAACYLLIGITGIGMVGCKNTGSSDSNILTLDQPVRLVAENDREAVFVSLPSVRRQPGEEFSPQVLAIDESGTTTQIPIDPQRVEYLDPVTEETNLLHLLGFDWAGNKHWIADPQYPAPQFWRNPQNPSLLLFQPQYNLGGLYLLDTTTLEVKAIGDRQALQAAIAKSRSLPPVPPPPNCKESECEAGVRILYWAADPSWSPDGDRIAFTSNRESLGAGSDMSVWVLDVATGKATKVTGSTGDKYRIFGWSADDRILAWEHSRSPDALVAIAPPTGEKQLLLQGKFLEFLALSDDYKTFLYASRPPGDNPSDTSFAKLYAFSLDTGESQLIFEESPTERLSGVRPDFSEDSDRIVAALSDAEGGHTVLVYHLKRQQTQRFSLPPDRRLLATERKLEWAGDRIVIPLEDSQTQTLSTLLLETHL